MAEVGGKTIMVAIQALDTVRRDTAEARHDMDDNDRADLDELLMTYDQAARELQGAYEIARKSATNLPPYEQLIRRILWKKGPLTDCGQRRRRRIRRTRSSLAPGRIRQLLTRDA